MLLGILSIYLLALLAPLIVRWLNRRAGWLLSLLPLGLAGCFAWQVPALVAGQKIAQDVAWVAGLDIRLAFTLDGLSALMALLIVGIGALVIIFSGEYLPAGKETGRFFTVLLLFMGSMLGLVLTDDLIVLFVFWELTSFSSFLLIGHDHDRPQARAAALQALLVTAGGGLALLVGLVMLGHAGGAMRFTELVATGAAGVDGALAQHRWYVPMVLLIVLGAGTKSAQFPFHFWLPNAMEAPAPVSAYLHAATMVKAGIYLLARVSPILGGTLLWQHTLMIMGGLTMVAASLLTLHQCDMKRLLAYSTVSALGVMTLLLGVGTKEAAGAMVVFLLAHALYKGALFLVAGAVDHATGQRRVDRLGGLRRVMPLLAMAAGLAGASMAGLFPSLGFIGKEGLLEALGGSFWPLAGLIVAVAASAVLTAAAFQVGLRPFLGTPRQMEHAVHVPGAALLLGPATLALGGVVFGLWPGLLAPLLDKAAQAVWGAPVDLKLALWHGLNLPLLLGAMAFALGVVLYFFWDRLVALADRIQAVGRWGPARGYELAMKGMVKVAVGQTRVLQSGYLRVYMLVIVVMAVGLVGSLLGQSTIEYSPAWLDLRPHEVVLGGVIILAAVAAIRAQSWLGAVAAMGVVGYGVAVFFVLFGAPDLAMTQFLIETLTVILFVLIIYHLPRLTHMPARGFRMIKAVVSLAVGVMMAVLVLAAAAGPDQRETSEFYLRHALPQGFGRNVVNVILVDFRALDTMGEITVLAVAGIGVYAVVQIRRVTRRRP